MGQGEAQSAPITTTTNVAMDAELNVKVKIAIEISSKLVFMCISWWGLSCR